MALPRNLVSGALLILATGLSAQNVSTDSPFVGPSGPQAAAGAETNFSDYEFVGILGNGKTTRFGLLKKSTQKSFWGEEGKEVEGLTVVRREGNNRIVVQQGGSSFTLQLKAPNVAKTAATVVFNPPPAIAQPAVALKPTPPPMGQLPHQPPTTNSNPEVAEKEREARMLVSDLLEIGMQQRKAYEDAQKRKAAEGTPVPPKPANSR